MSMRNTIYYEFWKNDNEFMGSFEEVVAETVALTTGIDFVPTLTFTIPLKNLPEQSLAAYTVKVFIQAGGENRYAFIGVVDSIDIDYASYTVQLSLSHRISRMRDWVMPANYTVKNTNVSFIATKLLSSPNSPGPDQPYQMNIEYVIESDDTVEMTFAADNKLEALSEMVNNTESLHWRVDLTDPEGDKIVIGKFGGPTDCEITPYPFYADEECETAPNKYVTMLTEPVFTADYTDHYNRAVVFCGDVGEGVFHLTLKEVYEHPELQIAGFPVGMYNWEINLEAETEYDENKKVINNEKIYKDNEIVAFANNTNREYYVTDADQLAEDSGVIRHTTFNFADLYPIPKLTDRDDDGNEIEYAITDADRREITVRAYKKAIRELKAQRPEHTYQFNCTRLPIYNENGGINVTDGSKVHFIYSKHAQIENEDCDEYTKKQVVNINEELYVTRRVISFDNVLNEYTTLTLDKELRPRAINAVEVELREKISEGDGGNSYKPKSTLNAKVKGGTAKNYPNTWRRGEGGEPSYNSSVGFGN